MIIARFQFKPEHAHLFVENEGQSVIEMIFESVPALIATCREFEEYLLDCSALVDGKMIVLSSFAAK